MSDINDRYEIRTAIKTALSHSTLGFNALLASNCAALGLPPYTIDFVSGSSNFAEAHITPESDSDERRAINIYPAIMLYTSSRQFTSRTKNTRFSGTIIAHIDLYLSFRGRDGNDYH